MSARNFSKIRDFAALLRELRRTEPWGRRLSRHPVYGIWERVVGESVARVAQPAGFRGGRLLVEVDGSAWMQELQLSAETIRAKLNEALGREEITELRLRLGVSTDQGREREIIRRRGGKGLGSPRRPGIALEDEAEVEAALEALPEESLRMHLRHFLKRVRGYPAVKRGL